ncbi:MAG: DUF393 domain-containing protein [Hydrogenophaga sp.]|nr:DUF393 domain-containing protein [Hydrogenophaga sp.]
MLNEAPEKSPPLTVLYDGACPLCRREIGVYQGLRSETPVCYADVSDAAVPLPPGTTREQLLARFHVRQSDGTLISGASAMERLYRLFLRARPRMQRWAARLDR